MKKPRRHQPKPAVIAAVAAVARDGAIGRKGQLLCHLPGDMRHFRELTMGHSIVMGRKTLESFPRGPLPGRQNIVLTRSLTYKPDGVTIVHSIDEALQAVTMPGEVMIIGGAQVYAQAMPRVNKLYLTRLHATFDDADAFFPTIDPAQWRQVSIEQHIATGDEPCDYDYVVLERIDSEPSSTPNDPQS